MTNKKRLQQKGIQSVPMNEELAQELHKPVRKHFKKRRVVSKHVDVFSVLQAVLHFNDMKLRL